MQTLTKNFKMLQMVLLVALVAILSGCQHGMPKAPQGEFLIHNQPKGLAVCSDIQTAKPCPAVKISDTHKYIMFSPKTWESVQNYIDALIRKIQAESQEQYRLMQSDPDEYYRTMQGNGIFISESEIQVFRRHLKSLENNSLRNTN